jgi:hypothetical protein
MNSLAIIRQHCDLIFQEVHKLETTIRLLPVEERTLVQQLLSTEQVPVQLSLVTPTANAIHNHSFRTIDDIPRICHNDDTSSAISYNEKNDQIITADTATQTDFHHVGVTNDYSPTPMLDSLYGKRDASQFDRQDDCFPEDESNSMRNKRTCVSIKWDPCLVTPDAQHHEKKFASEPMIPDTDGTQNDDLAMDCEDMVCDNEDDHGNVVKSTPKNQIRVRKRLVRKPRKRVCRVLRSPKKWRRLILNHRLKSIFID